MDDLGASLLGNEDHMVGLRILAVIKRGSRRKSRNHATAYPGGGGRGGVLFLQEANGDVPLDQVASSRLE